MLKPYYRKNYPKVLITCRSFSIFIFFFRATLYCFLSSRTLLALSQSPGILPFDIFFSYKYELCLLECLNNICYQMKICNYVYVRSFPAHTSILRFRSNSSNSLSSINLSPSSVISNANG